MTLTFDTTELPRPIPEHVYLVGGCVRDLQLQREPIDYDIVVDGDARQFARQLARSTAGHLVALGKPDQILYRVVSTARTYDITPASGPSLTEDLKRRDFCINAIAYQPSTGRLIDPLAGLQDLERKTIRMVSRSVFASDPVRLLRAYRLAAELQFAVEADTAAAISQNCRLITRSAGERIGAELEKLLNTDRAHPQIVRMDAAGLLTAIIPELAPLKACRQGSYHRFDAFDHTLAALGYLEAGAHFTDGWLPAGLSLEAGGDISHGNQPYLAKTAMLLHDIGKPATRTVAADGNIHFYGHAALGAQMAEPICKRLRMSRRATDAIVFLIRHHLHPLALYTAHKQSALSPRAVSRFFIQCGRWSPAVLWLARADMQAKGTANAQDQRAFSDFIAIMLQKYRAFASAKQKKPALIGGKELIEHFRLTPGPLFARILKAVHLAQMAGEVKSRSEALKWVEDWLRDRKIGPAGSDGQ